MTPPGKTGHGVGQGSIVARQPADLHRRQNENRVETQDARRLGRRES
jgi:hypothetical protein